MTHFLRISWLSVLALFSAALLAQAAVPGDQGTSAEELFARAWKEVGAMEYPLLKDARSIKPRWERDGQGLRRADASLEVNSVLGAKKQVPDPINVQQPYVYLSASLQRRDPGVPGQPTADARRYVIGGEAYQLILTTGSSDKALAKRLTEVFETVFARAGNGG